MVNERIHETFENITGKLLKFILRQVESFHKFLILNFMNKLTYDRVFAGITNNIYSAKECDRTKNSVRTIQQCHLTLMVWSLGRNKEYMKSGFVCRELLGYLFRSLDNPQVEYFSLYDHIVGIAYLFLNIFYILARESRYYTVNKCSINAAALCEPFLKSFRQLPQVDILIDAILQMMSVKEYKFTRKYDKTFVLCTVECLITAIEQLSQFTRI